MMLYVLLGSSMHSLICNWFTQFCVICAVYFVYILTMKVTKFALQCLLISLVQYLLLIFKDLMKIGLL